MSLALASNLFTAASSSLLAASGPLIHDADIQRFLAAQGHAVSTSIADPLAVAATELARANGLSQGAALALLGSGGSITENLAAVLGHGHRHLGDGSLEAQMMSRFRSAAQYADIHSLTLLRLNHPDRKLTTHLPPLKTEKRGWVSIPAFRVQDDDSLAWWAREVGLPYIFYKGGIRMDDSVTMDSERMLARGMTAKDGVVAPENTDVPDADELEIPAALIQAVEQIAKEEFETHASILAQADPDDLSIEFTVMGGGKGGLIAHPRDFTSDELRILFRSYVDQFYPILSQADGEPLGVPAPDVNTFAQLMDWMAERYGELAGRPVPHSFTGKSIPAGGIFLRSLATALGGVIAQLRVFREELGPNYDPKDITVAVHGFGNAGSYAARFYSVLGFRVVAFSDSQGTYIHSGSHMSNGMTDEEIRKLIQLKKIEKKTGETKIDRVPDSNHVLNLKVDLLILAGLEETLTAENAGAVQARWTSELGNNVTDPEADAIMIQNGIKQGPDIWHNAGGVAVSGMEWLQGRQGKVWHWRKVLNSLYWLMNQVAGDRIVALQRHHDISMREAAFLKSELQIDRAVRMRYGLPPAA